VQVKSQAIKSLKGKEITPQKLQRDFESGYKEKYKEKEHRG